MQKLGVGVIGCGGISTAHLWAYRELADECDVIAVCDTNEEAARQRAADYQALEVYTDYRRLLQDERIQVVSVCLPHFLHAPVSIAAARAGKHVICEKPMAMTVGECHEMIAAARQNGVRLTVGSERVNPRYRFLRERSEEHTSELQSRQYLVCRLLLEKTKLQSATYVVCRLLL